MGIKFFRPAPFEWFTNTTNDNDNNDNSNYFVPEMEHYPYFPPEMFEDNKENHDKEHYKDEHLVEF